MAYRKLFAFGELLEITRKARVHGKTLIEVRNWRERINGVTDALLKRVKTLDESRTD